MFAFGQQGTPGQTTTAAPTGSLFAMPTSTTTAAPKPGFTLGGQVMTTPSAGGQPGSLGFTPGASLQSKPASFATPFATPTPQTNSGGFTLGQPLTTSTPGFTFGQTTAASATPSTSATTAPAGLVLGTTPSATPSGGVVFGGGTTTASATPAVTAAKTTAAATTTATQLTTGLSFGAATAATTSAAKPAAGLTFGATTAAATSTPAAGLLQGVAAVKPAASTTSFTLPGAQTAAPASTAATTTTTSSASKGPTMTFSQLEEKINKWSVQLEETERTFLHQATQVNAWDRQVIENGEKIVALNESVQRVKLDQSRLDHELDFILAQQRELEDMLQPLEDAVKSQAPSIYQQHADLEREHTYQLAENTDAQLKRMMQDIKDIIEHLNQSGAPNTSSDPLHQIARILNAHMDSLQWLDQNAAVLQRKVDEVAKQCEVQRKEQEHSFRLAFE